MEWEAIVGLVSEVRQLLANNFLVGDNRSTLEQNI